MSGQRELIDHLFRRKYGEILSYLLRRYGNDKFELAEESIQTAFQKALEKWPYSGVPENPAGWLSTVAQNFLLDTIKRINTGQDKIGELNSENSFTESEFNEPVNDIHSDDLMNMVFLCCNPEINSKAQICITLKAACGFTVAEISRSLGMNNESVKKIITRAKDKIASETEPLNRLENLNKQKIAERFSLVMEVLYAMFTEGYAPTGGELHLKKEIAEEAVYLCSVIMNSEFTPANRIGELKALLSLMLFQLSRFDERTDPDGMPKRLQDQDRSKWDTEMISTALSFLMDSKDSGIHSSYHIEARIAAEHSLNKSFETTNWEYILSLYDSLLKFKDTISVRMNRIAASLYLNGPEQALIELKDLQKYGESYPGISLEKSYHFNSLKAEILELKGDRRIALKEWENTLKLAPTTADKKFIEKKIKNLI